jgi:quercetin dioxygenase-like cupin family protein
MAKRGRNCTLLLAVLSLIAVTSARAQTAAAAGGEVDHELLRQALADHPGTDVIVVTAEYPPGAGTPEHEHPGHTYAYVLEGAVASQLEGQPLKTYTAGQMWSEDPHQHHIVCRNASSSAPAKLLVVFLAPHGKTLETYLPAK